MSFNNQYRPGGFGGLPVVTKYIIVINVVLFVLKKILYTQGIFLDDYLALHYHLAPAFKPYQFVTYIFMHADIAHLFLNMFGVYMFGQVLEMTWGPKRYLNFYLLCGLGAAAAQYAILHFQISGMVGNADLTDPINEPFINSLDGAAILGASGSLFGLLGAYGMLFPNQMLYVYFLFPIKAKWLVIIYGAIELFSGVRNSAGDNVAHFAHLGGLFVGILLVLFWRRNHNRSY